MNKHLQKAYHDYEKEECDFQKLVSWHLCFGIVASCDRFFGLGYPCYSKDPTEVVEYHHADTLFITYITGSMRDALKPYAHDYCYIAFQRSFKNSDRIRLLDMGSFYSKLK